MLRSTPDNPGDGRTPPRTKSPDLRGRRRPRTRPRGRHSWTRRVSGLRVGQGGVLGRRTAAGDVARERDRRGGQGEGRPRHGGGQRPYVAEGRTRRRSGGGRTRRRSAGRVVHAQVGPAAAARGGGAAVRGGGRGGRGGGWRGRPVWALERSVSLRLGLFERLQKARFVKVVS